MPAGGITADNYKPTEFYVESVLDYTSRYNNSRSIGYAPENLVGKELRYPSYGDFPDTYILVSYITTLCFLIVFLPRLLL